MITIGLDIGTTTICGVRLKDGKEEKSICLKNDTTLPSKNEYEHIQDAEKIESICKIILEEISEGADAIGVTGQMHGVVYIDQNMKILSPLYTWRDQRAQEIYQNKLSYAESLQKEVGLPVKSGYGSATHFFNLKNKLVPKNAKYLCTIGDFIAHKLAKANKVLLHSSNAASMGCFSLKNHDFGRSPINQLQDWPNLFPHVTNVPTVIGNYHGAKVYTAIGDNQASVYSSKPNKNTLTINIGTGSQVSAIVDNIIENSDCEYRPYVFGNFLITGSALCGGYSYQLLKNFYESVLKGFDVDSSDIYSKMNAAAEKAYSSDHLPIFSTLFNGSRNNPNQKASISFLSPENFNFENLTAALLYGETEELYTLYQSFPPVIKDKLTNAIGAGNGIRNNPILQNIIKKRFNIPFNINCYKEEAAYGAAMIVANENI